jgi:hypothetical protein
LSYASPGRDLRGEEACEVIATVLDGGILADGDGVERLPGLSEALETRPDDPVITRAWELVSEKREARRRADADWLDEWGPEGDALPRGACDRGQARP